jgi:hypothetical protein
MTARESYDRALAAMTDYYCDHVDRWTAESVARYGKLLALYQRARRRLYLAEPDERATYSLFLRLAASEPTESRIARCETHEADELAALAVAR